MKRNCKFDELVSELCAEIDMLRDELSVTQAEAKHWKAKHDALVMQDIAHGQAMVGNMLGLALNRPELFAK